MAVAVGRAVGEALGCARDAAVGLLGILVDVPACAAVGRSRRAGVIDAGATTAGAEGDEMLQLASAASSRSGTRCFIIS
jgi:hypothetical protein